MNSNYLIDICVKIIHTFLLGCIDWYIKKSDTIKNKMMSIFCFISSFYFLGTSGTLSVFSFVCIVPNLWLNLILT